jgi:hypothetical protein
MSTFPTSPRSDFLLWAQNHAATWSAAPGTVGLTAGMCTALTNACTSCQTNLGDQEAAKQAYRTMTTKTAGSFDSLRTLVGEAVRTIRAFAENSSDPGVVYEAAQIPPPAPPSPQAPPAQPTNLRVELDPTSGELTLLWKASNPGSGTAYIVRRKLPGETEFSFIGVTGEKKFTDETLFAGPDSVQYTVQGQRANSTGPVSTILTVNFGRAGGGGFTISSQSQGGMAQAA